MYNWFWVTAQQQIIHLERVLWKNRSYDLSLNFPIRTSEGERESDLCVPHACVRSSKMCLHVISSDGVKIFWFGHFTMHRRREYTESICIGLKKKIVYRIIPSVHLLHSMPSVFTTEQIFCTFCWHEKNLGDRAWATPTNSRESRESRQKNAVIRTKCCKKNTSKPKDVHLLDVS